MGYLPGAFQSPKLSTKVSVLLEDITKLHVDAIVNPTNPNFYNGGGRTTTAAIMRGAGAGLATELTLRPRLEYGNATTTPSFELPCHYVIHTAVPAANEPGSNGTLASCYRNSLKELAGQRKDTIAFPCIGTGVQRFDHERAAHIAMAAVREFFDNDHLNQVKHVIFCVYSEEDKAIYQRLTLSYFA